MDHVEILYAEDSAQDADMTIRALKMNNISNKIHWVEDGAEALDFVFARGNYENRKNALLPKLILLDLKMPKVDGIEVLKEIRNNSKTKAIPVVILTSSNQEIDVVNSYDLGVNSYIVKPIRFKEFQNAIRDLGMYWLLLNKMPDK